MIHTVVHDSKLGNCFSSMPKVKFFTHFLNLFPMKILFFSDLAKLFSQFLINKNIFEKKNVLLCGTNLSGSEIDLVERKRRLKSKNTINLNIMKMATE